MQVRPQDEQRDRPEDAARRRPSVVDEQPGERNEEREDERLRPERRRAQPERDRAGDRHVKDVPRRAAPNARKAARRGERAGDDRGVRDQRQPEAAERVQAVVPELREPLLVDPAPAVPPDGQRVVARQAVVDDQIAAEERVPPVRAHLGGQECEEAAPQGRGDGQQPEVTRLEPPHGRTVKRSERPGPRLSGRPSLALAVCGNSAKLRTWPSPCPSGSAWSWPAFVTLVMTLVLLAALSSSGRRS